MRLIGLAGPARSGKDTVAEILRADGWITIGFADPVKHMLRAGFGPEATAEARKEEPIEWLGVSPRELMQTLGTEWGRQTIAHDLWVRVAERRIAQMSACGAADVDVAITDVRFDNEAEWIRAIGGKVWHLRRPNAPGVRPHASEAGVGLETDDTILLNDGTLDDLIDTVADALREIDQGATA